MAEQETIEIRIKWLEVGEEGILKQIIQKKLEDLDCTEIKLSIMLSGNVHLTCSKDGKFCLFEASVPADVRRWLADRRNQFADFTLQFTEVEEVK
ncbi:MAG: hypothetical protein A2445_00590 [Candidatus Jacksonbacteria bacterium RIFOXYC2_FULL_44_29]|nr:MAG: hypothetical protein UW45_C0010G0025 [Parcubacteria group bacterium GW2011_GWC2_44_22]OGY76054.1 MAG: hypothetical protein A2295_03805 [Candidatus Jacksonbacteria bacterium RIFOXYB2_FULL_44_15]OGY76357.1 MAG: hypothetical protein A2240_04320 [Candidatus Jacksonbacteria bacterium RIFOXYA2_FULL_43_12]OGY77995.1 MAG: hypothetical protein A2445_00590 [Candidatus Jacksonbacteria bacterium RIFOXYC2_FULL_44_29]OGY80333.1 MAG: hypothetical protein A2550_04495 [Candidatus Jacksonbacteria bacteri